MLEMREMKEAYVTPEMEIVSFETEDVITTSSLNETSICWFDEDII